MNMDDKKIDELINKALQEEQALPEGLSRRLEKQIDTWASTEEKKTRSLTRRRTLPPPSCYASAFYNTNRRIKLTTDSATLTPIRKMPPLLPKRLYSYSRRTSTKASARWITPGRR